jgi:hypothetical protein
MVPSLPRRVFVRPRIESWAVLIHLLAFKRLMGLNDDDLLKFQSNHGIATIVSRTIQ